MIFAIVIISVLFLILFFSVTVAGGRAHDKANGEDIRKRDQTPE